MNTIVIEGTNRASTGKKATKATRRDGHVPCVVYGGESNIHFSAPVNAFKNIIYTPNFNIAEVKVEGKSYNCIVKDVVFHPVTDQLVHIDFLNLVPGKKIKVDIPVHFEGIAPGIKTGGTLVSKLRTVSVKTTPEGLVDALHVDISELELGQSVRVRDLDLPEGMEVLNPPAIPVASVEVPRALKSAEAEEEEAAEAAAAAAEAEGEEGAATEAAETPAAKE